MTNHSIVSQQDWLEARKELLAKEKQFTKLRDELSQQRRDLPWHKLEKDYVFAGPNGEESLADLFDGRSQLIVYHFMFADDWDAGCSACSFLADHYNPAIVHLNQRDVSMVAISHAPLPKLEAFKKRMGWSFKWLSSNQSDFNHDFQVSFTQEQVDNKQVYYNYRSGESFSGSEAPGISVFYKDENGDIYHTYSAYARGLDLFIGAYNLLDIVPKGRDEDNLDFTMAWIKHHDRY